MLRVPLRIELFLLAATLWLWTPGGAQSSGANEGARQGAQRGIPREEQVYYQIERSVSIPSGDLRRLTLPRLRSGTLAEIEIRAADDTRDLGRHHLNLEILHGSSGLAGKPQEDSIRSSTWNSVFLYAGPWEQAVRYRTVRDGDFVLVLRQQDPERRPLAVKIRVQLQGGGATSEPEAPYELSRETRTAVIVFSAGLLWTTLLLCGAPIMRAFRDERRRPEPPWYA